MLLQLDISCLQEKAAHWRNVDRGRRVREHPTLQAIEAFLNLLLLLLQPWDILK